MIMVIVVMGVVATMAYYMADFNVKVRRDIVNLIQNNVKNDLQTGMSETATSSGSLRGSEALPVTATFN